MIDAHHHLWTYAAEEYPWMTDDKAILRRDYGIADLEAVLEPHGIDRTVLVQARQSLEETAALAAIRKDSDLVAGVVGWVPLEDEAVGDVLAEWADRLVGVRHVIQDERDGFMERPAFNEGLARLVEHSLAYDLLLYPRQLAEAIKLVDRHEEVRFVIDHAAKPRIGSSFDAHWDRLIREIAQRPNVFCKVSGLTTEVQLPAWTVDTIRPYFETLVDAFTPRRLMYGSDWPVALLSTTYERWFDAVTELAKGLTKPERNDLFAKTAERVYRLKKKG